MLETKIQRVGFARISFSINKNFHQSTRQSTSTCVYEHMIKGKNLVTASANAINNHRQRADCLLPVAAAIVKQNYIAAALIVRRTRRQVCQHIGRDLLG